MSRPTTLTPIGDEERLRPDPAKLWPVPTPVILIAVFLIVVVAAGLVASVGRFDGLYGQDPYAYFDYATGPLRQSLVRLAPPPPFYWPPGYPFFIALVSFAVGARPLAGQLVSLIAGGLVPVFTVLLAREIVDVRHAASGRRGAVRLAADGATVSTGTRQDRGSDDAAIVMVIAGLVTALNGQLWQSSMVVMADTSALVLATMGASAVVRYMRGHGGGWLILASAGLAGAVATRWAYALVAIPSAVFALLALGQYRRRAVITHLLWAGLVAAAVLGPIVLPAVHDLLLATDRPAHPAAFATDLQVYEWNPHNALQRTFVTADGRLSYRIPNGLYYALAPAHPYFFTPLLAWLILPGIWTLVRRHRAVPSLLILGWPATIYAFHAGAAWQNFRFTLAYLPPLAILLAIGATTVSRAAIRSAKGIGRCRAETMARWITRGWLILGLAWMIHGGVTLTRDFVARKDADLATVRWVQAQLPDDAVLLTFGLTLTFRHYASVETVDLSELAAADLSRVPSQQRTVFVLVDVANLETQWLGRAPDENFRALRSGPGLIAVGHDRTYTLFASSVSARADPGGGRQPELGARHHDTGQAE